MSTADIIVSGIALIFAIGLVLYGVRKLLVGLELLRLAGLDASATELSKMKDKAEKIKSKLPTTSKKELNRATKLIKKIDNILGAIKKSGGEGASTEISYIVGSREIALAAACFAGSSIFVGICAVIIALSTR